jgi:hypothetical protein
MKEETVCEEQDREPQIIRKRRLKRSRMPSPIKSEMSVSEREREIVPLS